jgi:AraC-like DNA-binding protein
MKQATRFTVQSGWKLLFRDMGLNPAHVLALARLPADLFAQPGATLSAPQYFQLWSALEQAAGGEALPLKIGQAISVESFDPPIFASLCSPSLNVALQRLAQYKRLIGPLTMEVAVTPQRTTVTLDAYDHLGRLPRSLGATELVFFTQLARLATRQRVVPVAATLPELPTDLAPYEAFLGLPLRRGKTTSLAFAAGDAERPFLTENTAMWAFFEPTLRQRLADLDSGASLRDRVHSALLELLPSGRCAIEDVAGELALSKRSLQRHLTDEGTSFQDVLNATRAELARHYLARSSHSAGEISWLLGFQDGNSFIRAFKGWTGQTPGNFRAAASGTSLPLH